MISTSCGRRLSDNRLAGFYTQSRFSPALDTRQTPETATPNPEPTAADQPTPSLIQPKPAHPSRLARIQAWSERFVAYLWLITRYQAITKLPFVLVILPVYRLAITWLIHTTGHTALSSSNVFRVLLTPQGLVITGLSIAVVLVAIAIDITAFILMEGTRLHSGHLPTARQTLRATVRTLRQYGHPSSLLIVAFVAVIVPLSGVGLSLDLFKRVSVPNFVQDVIFNSPTYSALYVGVLILFAVIGTYATFIFHEIALDGCNPWQAFRCSAALVHGNILKVARPIVLSLFTIGVLVALAFVVALFLAVLAEVADLTAFWRRYWILVALLHLTVFLGAVSLYSPPFTLFTLTRVFVALRTEVHGTSPMDGALPSGRLPVANPSSLPTRMVYRNLAISLGLVVVSIATLAGPAATQLEALAAQSRRTAIPVIAHRGGGDLGPENTVPSLESAIANHIPWSEVDVQRTKDGGYIINHDSTFARLSGSSATASDLTTAEASALPVANLFSPDQPGSHIPTLEQILETAKGRINLFIELKGATADTRMVDDVIAMVRAHQMEDQVVLVGLDYDLIAYSESQYPEVDTGFIYFFSVGDVTTLTADYLIMEEAEVTTARVNEIRDAGKRVVVWTVNNIDNVEAIAHLPLDGIITDHPVAIAQSLAARNNSIDLEHALNWLFIHR